MAKRQQPLPAGIVTRKPTEEDLRKAEEDQRSVLKLLRSMKELRTKVESLEKERILAESIYGMLCESDRTLLSLLKQRVETFSGELISQSVSSARAELEDKEIEVKALIRDLESPVNAFGFMAKSSSSGFSLKWNVSALQRLGYGDIVIGNRPLIQVKKEVDEDVWHAAIERGLIDLEKVMEEKAYSCEPKTRKAVIKVLVSGGDNDDEGEDS